MSLLYIVSESGNDAFFYALGAARITGREFTPVPMENRKGDGVEAVKVQLKYALRQARAAARGVEPVCFLAAIDNDRSPHPENDTMDRARLVPQEQKRASRMEWMLATVEAVLGQNRNVWPLPVALAVPVEMIEAWIVRARREAEPQPTPQWKELAAEEEKQSGHTDRLAFYELVVRELDADALAARSLSFRMFKEWLDAWPRAAVPV